MNQAHLHLLLNHLPILGTLFGILVLLTGFLLKHETVKRTGLGLFVFAAVSAIPAFLTGEGAEEVVEGLPGVGENLIERHEDLANYFLWTVIGLGMLSLATFYATFRAWKAASLFYVITLIVSFGAMVFAYQAGTSGGEIRHTEIRSDTMVQGTIHQEGSDEDDD